MRSRWSFDHEAEIYIVAIYAAAQLYITLSNAEQNFLANGNECDEEPQIKGEAPLAQLLVKELRDCVEVMNDIADKVPANKRLTFDNLRNVLPVVASVVENLPSDD